MRVKGVLRHIRNAFRNYWYIYRIWKSGMFNDQWYLHRYKDVRLVAESSVFWRFRKCRYSLLRDIANLLTTPIRHYVKHGAKEGREPVPWFSIKKYLKMHPESFANPFYHYVAYGRFDERVDDREINRLRSLWEDFYYFNKKFDLSQYALPEGKPQGRPVKTILVVDDRIPHAKDGAGYPRANLLLKKLVKSGFNVTLYPMTLSGEGDWAETHHDVPGQIEIAHELGQERFLEFMQTRSGYYSHVLVSRPHNMRKLKYDIDLLKRTEQFHLIYDAEAIFANRDKMQMEINGPVMTDSDFKQALSEELLLANTADSIFAVSKSEAAQFMDQQYDNVQILGHALSATPTPRAFKERSGILFVGNMNQDASPNVDSMVWFVNHVLPLLRQSPLMADVSLVMAGTSRSDLINELGLGDGVELVGQVDDLGEFYDSARIFIAPTRFCAGIPHKVHEAAAHGLPIVVTDVLREQLGWASDDDLLSCNVNDAQCFAKECMRLYEDEDLWNIVRANALRRVELECSEEAFEQVIKGIECLPVKVF